MAGLRALPNARGQFAAIVRLRWQVTVNSLRSRRGRLELVSRIFAGFGLTILGVGGGIACGIAAWYFFSTGMVEWLAFPLWGIFLYWQVFPIVATALSENFDASNFLRFPLGYRSYFLMRIVYGMLDPSTIVGCLWLIGMAAGIGIAARHLLLWGTLVLAGFAVVNILLSRAVFSWLERWLARRRSREILGFFFFLFIISFQFIGPAANYYLHRYRGKSGAEVAGFAEQFSEIQQVLPPGLVASALSRATEDEHGVAVAAFAALCVYGGVFFWLLDARLRAQFLGESLSESAAIAGPRPGQQEAYAGWSMLGFSGSVAAVLEKEFRYISRSGPMLFNMAMPILLLLIFRFRMANSVRGGNLLVRHIDFAFPLGAAYALLILSNLTYNSFGMEGAGVQFFFLSPVRFREILFAKNLAQGAMLALEMVLVWIVVCVFFRPPATGITVMTLAGALFAAVVNFIAGDLLSLYSPTKFDVSVFGRQRASGITVFIALGVLVGVFCLVGPTLVVGAYFNRVWLASLFLLVLAGIALQGYRFMLSRVDGIALKRRESLIAELCRA